jgi:hypothetical protein
MKTTIKNSYSRIVGPGLIAYGSKGARGFARLRQLISQIWNKVNLDLAEAREIQNRIDQVKLEQLKKHFGGRWPL